MKYAVISDAHANPLALKAALEDARKQRCEKFVFLGDVTGYGYDVKETIQLVRENFSVVLMGNHDSACAGLEPWMDVHMNKNYHVDLIHRKDLSEEEIQWLKALPYVHVEGNAAFVHGDFTCPEAWRYIFSPQDIAVNLVVQPEQILFCGHTHHAAAWAVSDAGEVSLLYSPHPESTMVSKSFAIKGDCRYVVNVGSVGYPRCDFCSTYVIYDTVLCRMMFRRLPLNLHAYAEKLVMQGISLPLWLSDALDNYP